MSHRLLTGANLIEGKPSTQGTHRVPAHRGEGPATATATSEEIARAAEAAAAAFDTYGSESPERRAAFLEAIASEIEGLGDALLQTANAETALPLARLTGERGRTTGQLRMFATLLRDGGGTDVRIETADPNRAPLPTPDLRRTL
ncbi:aldehyde dehydrogenase family protein, partial [bacterium]